MGPGFCERLRNDPLNQKSLITANLRFYRPRKDSVTRVLAGGGKITVKFSDGPEGRRAVGVAESKWIRLDTGGPMGGPGGGVRGCQDGRMGSVGDGGPLEGGTGREGGRWLMAR